MPPAKAKARTPARSEPIAEGEAGPLHARIARTGEDLVRSLARVVRAVGGEQTGPVALARDLRLDKVLMSRLLRALDAGDPFAAVHRMPGPEPLRRLLRACAARGAGREELARAEGAVERFDRLINADLGDRQALDTIVAAWVPDVRRAFELRRKQAAFRAVSELRGIRAQTLYSAVLLAPTKGAEDRIDVVWLSGSYGVHRVRPDAVLKLATRRVSHPGAERRPVTLAGVPVGDDPEGARLPAFCSDPPPPLIVRPMGEVVHYILGPTGYGPGSAVDLVMGERSPADLPRRVETRPERPRRAHFFAEVSTPAEMLVFDLFADERLWPGQSPELALYDTSFEGVASVNDPARDVDRLDLLEAVTPLGAGIDRAGSAEVPRGRELLREACRASGIDGAGLRGFRVRIEYPLYGSQATLSFLAETA